MKQAISQESMSDSSHSCIQRTYQNVSNGSSIKSAALLGLALSVGASGVLVAQSEAAAAVSTMEAPATANAFSSDFQGYRPVDSALQTQVVAHHTVESGQSLWQIAQLHRVGLQDLKTANNLPVETSIRVGQVLKVPGAAVAVQSPTQAIIQNLTDRESKPIELATTSNLAPGEAETVAKESTTEQNQSAEGRSTDLQPTVQNVPQLDKVRASFGIANSEAHTKTDSPSESSVEASVESTGAQLAGKEVQPSAALKVEIAEASSIESKTVSNSAPVVATLTAPSQPLISYQVQSGDTLASIASSLGTTTATLVSVNDLTNPDVIMPGFTLVVPTDSGISGTEIASRSDQSAQTAAKSRLARLRSTAVRQNGTAAEDIQSKDTQSSQAVMASDDQAAVAQGGIDPYVANLLEEVQDIQNQPVQVAEAQITEVEASVSNSPRIVQRVPEQIAITPTASPGSNAVDPTLLAAAPLSPEAYVPAQRSPAGQVVSPDMPLLPEADEFLPEAPNYFDGYIWPTRGTLTSGYGWRWGRMHRGVDVAGPVGTPIVAAGRGVVEKAGWNSGGYGNLVEIRHPDGSLTLYAHNNRLNVSTGQTVKQGQKIAEMGSTGYSTGPHLHFEVHMSGKGAVNPVAYLPSR